MVFWDLSFLGLRSGDIYKDAEVLKLFADQGHQMIIAMSFSKIMSLYGNSR
jgi:Aspartate/tyrosine/aromatic aminotransferase